MTKEKKASKPVPDTDASIDFLQKFRPQGPWPLVAIDPVKGRPLFGKTFKPDQIDEAKVWINSWQGDRNLYFHVNPIMGAVKIKASKEDVAELAYIHIDIDPRIGEDIEEEQKRALSLLTDKLPEALDDKKPTFVVFSGGGYQGFWKLSDPIDVDGNEAKCEDAERYIIQLILDFNADTNCKNIDRIMRLPGTINMPDAAKKKKGRVPALAKLIEYDEKAVYAIEQFKQARKIVKAAGDGLNGRMVSITGEVKKIESIADIEEKVPGGVLPNWVKDLIMHGYDPRDPGNNQRGLPKQYTSASEALFAVCCALVKADLDDNDIYAIITDPKYHVSDCVRNKPNWQKRYAVRQIERAREQAISPWLRKLNEKHAVIADLGGHCKIVTEYYDEDLRRYNFTKQSFQDFMNRYSHKKVPIGTKTVNGVEVAQFMAVGKWWIDNEYRRQFERMVFAPGKDPIDCYNLWKGYAFQPEKGDCSLYLDHMKRNICSGNDEHYQYLLSWMARAIQEPDCPGEVAVVLRGRMGTGKSFFVKKFGRLYGSHFVAVSNAKHLIGSFNAHLRDCVVLFGDEAFYAGDKKHESSLKMLVTEEMVPYEPKGVDTEMGPNYCHVILASNDDWVVPAGADERRFFVLDVGDENMNDTKYFGPMNEQLENGGYEALLYILLNRDLSQYIVQKFPETAALRKQKLLSLADLPEWWYSKLVDGRILPNHEGWYIEIPKKALIKDYTDYSQSLGYQRRANPTKIGIFLNAACPGIYPMSNQKTIEYESGKKREYVYTFPGLEDCRKHFDKNYGGGPNGFDWPDLDERDNDPQEDLPLEDGEEIPF